MSNFFHEYAYLVLSTIAILINAILIAHHLNLRRLGNKVLLKIVLKPKTIEELNMAIQSKFLPSAIHRMERTGLVLISDSSSDFRISITAKGRTYLERRY